MGSMWAVEGILKNKMGYPWAFLPKLAQHFNTENWVLQSLQQQKFLTLKIHSSGRKKTKFSSFSVTTTT